MITTDQIWIGNYDSYRDYQDQKLAPISSDNDFSTYSAGNVQGQV